MIFWLTLILLIFLKTAKHLVWLKMIILKKKFIFQEYQKGIIDNEKNF